MKIRFAFVAVLFLFALPAAARPELCVELMRDQTELEQYEVLIQDWKESSDNGGAMQQLGSLAADISETSRLIATDVFADRYEKELARGVMKASAQVEEALSEDELSDLEPAYDLLMENLHVLTNACFERQRSPKADPNS